LKRKFETRTPTSRNRGPADRKGRLPQVGPADQVGEADYGDKDGGDVEKEPGGGVAVLVGGAAGHPKEEDHDSGNGKENSPERDAANMGGQGGHEGMLQGEVLKCKEIGGVVSC
jgi:hypothetical protein